MLEHLLAEYPLPPAQVDIEIAEHILLTRPEQAEVILQRLLACGVGVTIDDFGTGSCSFEQLKRLPSRALKIDHSLIRHVTANHDDAMNVAGIIAMAHALGRTVIAESVETSEQVGFLQALSCDMLQGHLFSTALPADACTALLTDPQQCWGDGGRRGAV